MGEKKLTAFLKEQPNEQKILVGSGTSFFYAGTVEDFLVNLGYYNKLIQELNKQKKSVSANSLRTAATDTKSYGEWARTELLKMDDDPDLSFDTYLKYLKHRSHVMANKQRYYIKSRLRIDKYVGLKERKVKDTFFSSAEDEQDVLKVVITGDESGNYMLYREMKDRFKEMKDHFSAS